MNIQNLSAIAALCRTLPQDKFNMEYFRLHCDAISPECGSVGSVLGHATVLDPGPFPRHWSGGILFGRWSASFTDLGEQSPEWDWCFASEWAEVDNSPLGAAKRIEWLLAGNEVPGMQNGITDEMVAMYS